MADTNNIYNVITTLATLAVGGGGYKILSLILKYRNNDKEDKKDGWQFAIQTLKAELEMERQTAKQYAIDTTAKIVTLQTKVDYLEKRGRLLETALIKNGMIDEVTQIDYIMDQNTQKIEEIHQKVQKRVKKQTKQSK